MKIRQVVTLGFLVGIGSLQIAADALGMSKVKGFAAALQVSPAMKVFTAHKVYETHAARFEVLCQYSDGLLHFMALNPQSYAKVDGPYNRRNVYGAAFAYGPLLRDDPNLRPMHESVIRYALCTPGSLRKELGIPVHIEHLTAHVLPVRPTQRQDLDLSWEVECHE
jgi:hypothetical protein